MPLDCCTRPDYSLSQQNGRVYASVQWLAELLSRVQTSLHSRLRRRQQPDIDASLAQVDQPIVHESLAGAFSASGDEHQQKPSLADTDIEPLDALLSEVDVVSRRSDLTEETHDGIRELQLR